MSPAEELASTTAPGASDGLSALEARVKHELDLLGLPAKPWSVPKQHDGRPMLDVAIIGAGMTGLCAAAALWMAGLPNIRVFDRSPAGHEGPWITSARMETLRTAKDAVGPALGVPSLTYRAWYEAVFGSDAWRNLDRAPRSSWIMYLNWYRSVLDIEVQNETTVVDIRPLREGLIKVETASKDGAQSSVFARRVVLATGFDGFGGPVIPDVCKKLNRRFWAHASDSIDFSGLSGRRVGVIGIGASAVDNASMALESGASSVDIFVRRAEIPSVQKYAGVSSAGILHGFADLPDPWKIRFIDYEEQEQNPAPRQSLLRLRRHANYRIHLASPVEQIRPDRDAIVIETPKAKVTVDFLIVATGFDNAPGLRPELAFMAPQITRWQDYFPETAGKRSLGRSPYLSADFSFMERSLGSMPGLQHVYCLTYAASLSIGRIASGIPALSEGAKRVANAIAGSIFVEDRADHFRRMQAYSRAEFEPEEWYTRDSSRLPKASNRDTRR